jgi:hypothetical protein
MTGFEHTIIAVAMLMIFYYAGRFTNTKEKVEEAIATTLQTLEDRGYIVTKDNGKGEKELIPIKELDR